jgi:predicted anti-sigma-YlaC factor YlaD
MGEEIEGHLAGELRGGYDEHMAECAPCRNYRDQLRVTRSTLAGLPSPRAQHPRLPDLIETFRKEFEENN